MSLGQDVVSKSCPGAGAQAAHTEPVSMFAADKSRVDGKAPYCKKCAATKQREWKAKNPAKVKAAKLKYRMRPEPQPT